MRNSHHGSLDTSMVNIEESQMSSFAGNKPTVYSCLNLKKNSDLVFPTRAIQSSQLQKRMVTRHQYQTKIESNQSQLLPISHSVTDLKRRPVTAKFNAAVSLRGGNAFSSLGYINATTSVKQPKYHKIIPTSDNEDLKSLDKYQLENRNREFKEKQDELKNEHRLKKFNYVIVDKKDYDNYQKVKLLKEQTNNLIMSTNLSDTSASQFIKRC